nr:type I restriction-modification system subunit M N-terminal domain-containing protein [Candidatus Microthrix sp.]
MTSGDSNTIQNHAAFIWSVADLLRGDYKQSEYGKVILPLTVLRRLDCVLEPTKQAVLDRAAQLAGRNHNLDPILQKEAGEQFYNTSRFDFATLVAAPDDLADNLKHYVASFSTSARDVLDKFDFTTQIDRLDRSKLLYLVMSRFAEVDLHPDKVSNLEMGYLYEELIRKFSELSNETAGEHFTPREVIRLMVDLLFIEDDRAADQAGRHQDDLRRRLRHRRHVVGGRGPPARAQPRLESNATLYCCRARTRSSLSIKQTS